MTASPERTITFARLHDVSSSYGNGMDAKDALPGEAYLAFGKREPEADIVRNLSPTKNLHEAAANLFAMLHTLDMLGAETIAVAPIPDEGLGVAINDRLARAAAPRDQG